MRNNQRWNNVRFRTFQEAVDRVEEFSNKLDCDVFITLETDGTFTFFGNGKTIATWICGDQEDDLEFHGIYKKPNPKKGYLSRGFIEDSKMADTENPTKIDGVQTETKIRFYSAHSQIILPHPSQVKPAPSPEIAEDMRGG